MHVALNVVLSQIFLISLLTTVHGAAFIDSKALFCLSLTVWFFICIHKVLLTFYLSYS